MRDRKKKPIIQNYDFLIVDTIAIIVSFSISYLCKFKSLDFLSKQSFRIVIFSLMIINVLLTIFINPYSQILKRGRIIELRKIIMLSFYSFMSISIILFMLKIGQNISREVIISTYLYFVIIAFLFRSVWKTIKRKAIVDNSYKKNLLVVSYYENVSEIIHNIINFEIQEYNIYGICLIDKNSINNIDGYKTVCDIKDIYDYVSKNDIDEIFVVAKSNILSDEVVAKLLDINVEVKLSINHMYGLEPNDANTSKVGIYNTFGLGSFKFSLGQHLYISIKRVFDVLISIFGLLILATSMIAIKIANIISKDNGPLFYSQIRVGKDGRLFELIKFRSMTVNATEELDNLLKNDKYKAEWMEHQKFEADPRITKVGKFLRKTSLDEIPQFINVLKGDMSIVGPRPLIPGELELHNGIKLYELVRPGMTSWWACNGRSNINYRERLEFEYYYVKNISLFLDISCILKTVLVIIKRTGAQ